MTQFLQSNLTLVAGPLMVLVLLAIRAAASDATLRKDLRGANYFLIAFLLLRLASFWVEGRITPGLDQSLRVAWMLTFAFGAIRSLVSLLLWGLRLRARVPKILRDVIDFSLYATAAVPILKSQLDIDLTGLLATSAILSVVLGLALQDTLGNLFAGLTLQLEHPFQVGDFVTVGEHTGRVVQLAWRSTRIETLRRELVTLPNNLVAKQAVLNRGQSPQPLGVEVFFGVAYSAPPNRVRQVVLEVLGELPLLVPRSSVCRVAGYDDSSVRYQVRFFVTDFAQLDDAKSEFFAHLWYRFSREGIEIPFPQRTLHLRSSPSAEEAPVHRRELLSQVDLLQALSEDERDRIAREVTTRRFGRGEKIIVEGTPGQTFYLLASGEVSVRTGKAETEVTRLRRGQYFGEMSLLTGEARSATVVALEDATLLEFDRPSFARLFEEHPGLGRRLSAMLAERRAQLDAVATVSGSSPGGLPEESRIFTRLRQIFGLHGD